MLYPHRRMVFRSPLSSAEVEAALRKALSQETYAGMGFTGEVANGLAKFRREISGEACPVSVVAGIAQAASGVGTVLTVDFRPGASALASLKVNLGLCLVFLVGAGAAIYFSGTSLMAWFSIAVLTFFGAITVYTQKIGFEKEAGAAEDFLKSTLKAEKETVERA